MDTKKIKFFYDSFTSVIEEFAKTEAKKWNLDKVVAYPPNTKIDLNKLFEGDYLTYGEENHFDISKRRYPVSDPPIDLGFLDVNQVVEESQPKLYHRSDVKFAENLKILVNHNKIIYDQLKYNFNLQIRPQPKKLGYNPTKNKNKQAR